MGKQVNDKTDSPQWAASHDLVSSVLQTPRNSAPFPVWRKDEFDFVSDQHLDTMEAHFSAQISKNNTIAIGKLYSKE